MSIFEIWNTNSSPESKPKFRKRALTRNPPKSAVREAIEEDKSLANMAERKKRMEWCGAPWEGKCDYSRQIFQLRFLGNLDEGISLCYIKFARHACITIESEPKKFIQ
jgi:hypothetical protein